MSQQFNQTKKALRWTIGGKSFECEAWGAVDVPQELVEPCRKRGIPIASTAIAAEVRAARRKEDSVAASSDKAFEALKAEVAEAKAAESAAKEQADELQTKNEEQAAELRSKEEALSEMSAALESAKSEVAALSEQLSELTKKEVAATEKSEKAKATRGRPRKNANTDK